MVASWLLILSDSKVVGLIPAGTTVTAHSRELENYFMLVITKEQLEVKYAVFHESERGFEITKHDQACPAVS